MASLPSAFSRSQRSAVRRSCQTMARWIAWPDGAVPDHRGFALVGDADGGDASQAVRPPSARAPSTTLTVSRQISSGIVFNPAVIRIVLFENSFWATPAGRPSATKEHGPA